MASIVTTNLLSGKEFRVEYDDVWVCKVSEDGHPYEEAAAKACYTMDGERIAFGDMGLDELGRSSARQEYEALEEYVIVVTTDGRAVRCYSTDFKRNGRDSTGVHGPMGEVASQFTAKETDGLVVVTNKATMARFTIAAIRVGPRIGFGVMLMNLAANERVANVSVIPQYEEPDEEWGTESSANVSEA